MASRVALGLLLALAASCGRDEPASRDAAQPSGARSFNQGPSDAPAVFARLLPQSATIYTQVASIREVEQQTPWLLPLLLSTRFRIRAYQSGIDPDNLALDRPASMAWCVPPQHPLAQPMTVLVLPVHRSGEDSSKPNVRVHADYQAVGNGAAWTVGNELPDAARALPDAVVAGRIQLRPLTARVALMLSEALAGPFSTFDDVPIDAIRNGIAALEHLTWAAKTEAGVMQIDATLHTRPGGPFDTKDETPSPIGELLRCLPEDYPIVIAFGSDLRRVARTVEPIMKFAVSVMPELAADTAIEAWKQLGRGAVMGLRVGRRAAEGVLMANARDSKRFLELYVNSLRVQACVECHRLRAGEVRVVDGASVREFFFKIDARAMADGDMEEGRVGTALAFRVRTIEGDEPQRLATRRADAALIRRRLRSVERLKDVRVISDPDYIFLQISPRAGIEQGSLRRAEAAAQRLFARDDDVLIRQVLRPAHVSYPPCRLLLERALEQSRGGEQPDRVMVGQAAGLEHAACWYRLAHRQPAWDHRGYALVSLGAASVSLEDLDWAYVSSARRGGNRTGRDVHLRWKTSSLPRLKGAPHVAILKDRAFVLGDRQLGAIEDLDAEFAADLANALTLAPLASDYAYEGVKSSAFAAAHKTQAQWDRLVGTQGYPLRIGAVRDKVFAVIGADWSAVSSTIAAIRSGSGRAAPSWLHTPDADLYLSIDIERVSDGINELFEAMSEGAFPAFLPEVPADMGPVVLGAWHSGPNFRLRLRVPDRLGAFLHARAEQQRVARLERGIKRTRSRIVHWQQEQGVKRLPTAKELRTEVFRRWESGRDPWGSDYRVEQPKLGRFVVRSAGPDGRFETDDDVVGE